MVPPNRKAFCGTSPMLAWRRAGSSRVTSTPSDGDLSLVASNSLGIRESKVVLLEPVLPTMAVTCPCLAVKEMSRSAGASAPG